MRKKKPSGNTKRKGALKRAAGYRVVLGGLVTDIGAPDTKRRAARANGKS